MPSTGFATSFSNTFLLSQGNESVLRVAGPTEDVRKKRAHKKSRKGCVACKRRKVKCDEKYPCSNCIKRKEFCSLPVSQSCPGNDELEPPVLTRQPDPILVCDADSPINLLHLELFHHFAKVTVPTLSFAQIWDEMIKLAMHEEYLMNAMLSVAARHLSILSPYASHYLRAARILLSKSCAQFRDVLYTLPSDGGNCDAHIGTSILIHYMACCNLDFLDSQAERDISTTPLDLSRDQLFLMSPGFRQIFFTSWPKLCEKRSSFVGVAFYRPCNVLERAVDERGLNWRGLAEKFMDMYDELKQRNQRSIGTPVIRSHLDWSTSNSKVRAVVEGASRNLCLQAGDRLQLYDAMNNYVYSALRPAECTLPEREGLNEDDELILRCSYARIVNRISVILAFLDSMNKPQSTPKTRTPVVLPRRADIERYFLSFPLLWHGRYLELALEGDSRALVILYHIYHAARVLLGTQETWWAVERATAMEALIKQELEARGLEHCLHVEVPPPEEAGPSIRNNSPTEVVSIANWMEERDRSSD